MADLWQSTKPAELTAFIGKHFIYTYENGWQYEMYIKNARTIDYRIHSGMVGGRWVLDQEAHIVRLSDDIVKVSWDEPTGTTVSMSVDFATRGLHGVIFFPRWIAQNPDLTVYFQNEHLERMRELRDAGPTYPKLSSTSSPTSPIWKLVAMMTSVSSIAGRGSCRKAMPHAATDLTLTKVSHTSQEVCSEDTAIVSRYSYFASVLVGTRRSKRDIRLRRYQTAGGSKARS